MSKQDTIQIRSCTIEDFDSVFQLLLQLWPTIELDKVALEKIFITALSTSHQKLTVAIASDSVVGFCSLSIKANFWQAGRVGIVDELIVDKHHQGQGIGRQLMEQIASIAIENHCKCLELESSFHREQAHQFYKAMGFTSRAYWFSKTLTN